MKEDKPQGGSGVRLVTIGSDYSGQRLDNYLIRELKGVPRTRLYRALRKGEIRVNKGRVRPDYRLVAGDLLRLPPLRRPEPGTPEPVPLYWSSQLEQRVVFETRACW